MIRKEVIVTIDPDYVHILDNEILKTASDNSILNGHRFDPDFVYILLRAVSAGEYWGPNNNTDYFEESELLGVSSYGSETGYKTFMDAHVFKNHANKDIAGSIGSVLKAEWDDFMKAVTLVIRIDKQVAPTITRGFLKGTITDVSMGCRVDHVVCSICGKRAKVRRDYCEHLRDTKLRGKILDGGKRVFEINKGPRFHDISVVTRGADRTAKAARVIDGQKAALDQDFQKVASVQDKMKKIQIDPKFILPDKCKYRDMNFEKIAKEVSMLKMAEVEKIITGNIVAIASHDVVDKASEKSSDVMEIMRLFHTKNFDKETSIEIANKINEIAKEYKRNPLGVFKTFLRTAELSGIELTPLEFAAIRTKLNRKDPSHLFNLSNMVSDSMDSEGMKTVIRISRGDGLPRSGSFMLPGSELDMEQNIFSRILSPFMSERSTHERHMRPRIMEIIKVASDESASLNHFVLPLASMSKQASTELLDICKEYSDYQDARVKMAIEGDVEKYASLINGEYKEIIKEAMAFKPGTKKNRLLKDIALGATAYPLINGYSNYQKSRIAEGRRVGGVNRYVADHPTSAFLTAAVGHKLVRKNTDRAKKLIKEVPDALAERKIVAKANKEKKLSDAINPLMGEYDNIDDAVHWLEKESSDIPSNFDSFGVFSSEAINAKLSEKYAQNQIGILKQAMFEHFRGDDAEKDDLLENANLSDDDINSYLKIASNLITIELEKMAGEIADIAKDTAIDTLFYPSTGAGFGSMLPGSVIDGFVFNKAINHFEKKKKKKPSIEQPVSTTQKLEEVT